MASRVRDRAWTTVTMFIALALAWGSSFLWIKIGLEELTPEQVVWGRLVIGAATLLVASAVSRTPLPRDPRVWSHLVVVAILLCVVPFSLFAWAEQHVSSGIASALNAATPLLTMLVSLMAVKQERLSRHRISGLVIGIVGVLIVVGIWNPATGGTLTGQLACLGATTSYGIAFVYLRRFVAGRGLPALTIATSQVVLAALMMLAATPAVLRSAPTLTGGVVGAMTVLGVVGTGLAYVWNTAIVDRWGATTASTVTYLTPLVGVGLGVMVLGEQATWNQPVGAAVVVLGVIVTQGRARHRFTRHQDGTQTVQPMGSVDHVPCRSSPCRVCTRSIR